MPEPENIRGTPMSADELRQWRAFETAIAAGDLAALRTALGDPPDFPDTLLPAKYGVDHCLGYAIDRAPVSLVRDLIAAGADVNIEVQDGFPPLYAAAGSERPERYTLVAMLIEAGADPERRGFNGYTALHVAAVGNDPEMVKLLLERGADPQARTSVDDFNTPLEEAEMLGCKEGAEALRKYAGDRA